MTRLRTDLPANKLFAGTTVGYAKLLPPGIKFGALFPPPAVTTKAITD